MIEWIRLQNCQSWEDSTIHLAQDRINIIKADNNIGKSVLFRILKLAGDPTYYDKEERSSLIRWGASWAKVFFKFTDDSYAIMQIGKTKILYAYLPTADSKLNSSLQPPIEMVNHVGLLANSEEHFIANIIDMEQGLLLINPKLSSNYDLVRMIATDDNMDLLEERLDEVIREFKEKALRADDKKYFYEQQLALTKYIDVENLESLLNLAKTMDKTLDTAARVQGCQEAIVTGLEVSEKSENLIAMVDFLSVLEKIRVEVCTPPVSMTLWEALRVLERVRFAAVEVIPVSKERIPVEWLNFVLAMKEATAKIIVTTGEVKDDMLLILEILEKVTAVASKVQIVDGRELQELEKRFRESGQTVDCPVWGEVLWDGKECVVVNQ